MDSNLQQLPEGLPVPVDDGACDHLTGLPFPDLSLPTTSADPVNLARLPGRTVVYVYPMTGRPDRPLPDNWDAIAGARGCTPQSCAFRDHYQELQSAGAGLYGLSTQTSPWQQEARERLHLPFELLSDSERLLQQELSLPVFEFDGQHLYRRLTLILRDGLIEQVFYPVFPPQQNPDEVLRWLGANPLRS